MALVLDGKTFAESTMVVALGITMTGDKRFLGFVETGTENEKVLTPFLRSLVERGLEGAAGDRRQGAPGGVRKLSATAPSTVSWHKRENVVSDVAVSTGVAARLQYIRSTTRPSPPSSPA